MALTLARELEDPAGEAYALYWLATAASYVGNFDEAEAWLRQAERIDQAAMPGWIGRHIAIVLGRSLGEIGETAEGYRYCADALAAARQAGALYDQGDGLLSMALLDFNAGRLGGTRAHLREVIELFGQTGAIVLLINCLDLCADLCAATGRSREAVTVGAALTALRHGTWIQDESQAEDPVNDEDSREPLRLVRQMLEPAAVRAAEQRGAAMTPVVAAEYVLLLLADEAPEAVAEPSLPHLSVRDQELITLVAQGRTNAQIAAHLAISVRTVGFRINQIRERTGSQRRADLTRLALRANLV